MPDENVIFRRLCAWCKRLVDDANKPLGDRQPTNLPLTTHTICTSCKEVMTAQIPAQFQVSQSQWQLNLDATLKYVAQTDNRDLGDPAYYCDKICQYIREIIQVERRMRDCLELDHPERN